MDVKIESTWKEELKEEFEKPYFMDIVRVLHHEKKAGEVIYPPGNQLFNAFEKTPFDRVKCIILGQDPYHGPGQAHGLCFSVNDGVPPPPSLVNIFKELHDDLGIPAPVSGNLTPWALQGVFLLNAFLTVKARQPASHSKIGWEQFTNAVIRKLSDRKQGLVFLLWGRFAQNKQALIDPGKHHILMAAHPSPFSAAHGFFRCRHFSRTNALLQKEGKAPIQWNLP